MASAMVPDGRTATYLTRIVNLIVELMNRDGGNDDEALGWRRNRVGAVASLASAFIIDRGVIMRRAYGKGRSESQ
jgi:hypothetical protein